MAKHEQDVAEAGTYLLDDGPSMSNVQRRAAMAAVAVLVVAALFTIADFLAALAWAAIFAIALWPWFARSVARFPRHRSALLPLAFVLAVLVVFVLPLVAIALPLIRDADVAGQWFAHSKVDGIPPPPALLSLPFGDRLEALWQHDLGQPGQLATLLDRALQGTAFATARSIGAGVLHRLVLLAAMLLALFFLLRDGDGLVAELKLGSRRAFGPAGENVGLQVIRSIHGTVNGLVLVGLIEGLLLGIAYAIAGLPHASLFGLITALLAIIPFGAPVAIALAALILVAMAKTAAAVAVVAFGTVVVFVADHFVRPVLIGGATRLPFVWALLGVLGGVKSWGLVGLFIGPAIMATLVLLWREWVGAQRGPLNPAKLEVGGAPEVAEDRH